MNRLLKLVNSDLRQRFCQGKIPFGYSLDLHTDLIHLPQARARNHAQERQTESDQSIYLGADVDFTAIFLTG